MRTGIPFGRYLYSERAGPRILGFVPWSVPLLWTYVILNVREVARLIVRPWPELPNRGLWTLGLTPVLVTITDFNLEPFAVGVGHFWEWPSRALLPAWRTAPWTNFLGWFVTTSLLLVLVTLWLINKQPVKRPPPNPYPFWLWLAVNGFLVAANASRGLWDAVVPGLLLTLAAGILALRGLLAE